MDLLQGVKDIVDEQNGGGEGAPLPTRDELLQLLEGMTGMSEEDKENLRNTLLGDSPPKFDGGNAFFGQWMVLLTLLLVIASFFVFFGYKLYVSLAEREKRKEEKKMMKQMRKKK